MGKTKGKEAILPDVKAYIDELSKHRNHFSITANKISKPRNIRYKSDIAHKSISNLRFAFISLNVPDGKKREDNVLDKPLAATKRTPPIEFSNEWGLERDVYRRRLYLSDYLQSYQYLTVYIDAIQIALVKANANIVCVNELGIATNIHGPLPRFFREVRKLVEKNPALVITGSHHDPRTRYNTGYIFYPDCPTHGQPFHKQISATQQEIGEHISVPSERQSIVIKAFRFGISVITCLDLMDFSIISSLVQCKDKLDFILVPACSPKTEPLEEIAKTVSAVLPGGVFIVNEYRRGKKPSSRAYFFGGEDPRDPDVQIPLSNNGIIDIYDIPRKWFDDGKDNPPDPQSPNWPYQWLLKNLITI